MSEKKGKAQAIKLRKLAEAWAKEAQQEQELELELEADQVEEADSALRDALTERIALQSKPHSGIG